MGEMIALICFVQTGRSLFAGPQKSSKTSNGALSALMRSHSGLFLAGKVSHGHAIPLDGPPPFRRPMRSGLDRHHLMGVAGPLPRRSKVYCCSLPLACVLRTSPTAMNISTARIVSPTIIALLQVLPSVIVWPRQKLSRANGVHPSRNLSTARPKRRAYRLAGGGNE